jgi:TolB-like protein/Tfp pilus assembly protein PilF
MNRLKWLIVEIHRRSLWQVLLIYSGAALVAYQAVQALTEGLGLPQWFPAFAVVLFIVGLPVVLATAFVREVEAASPAPAEAEPRIVNKEADAARHEASRHRRLVTWRNAGLSFVAALAVWGVVATGWMLVGGRPARPQIGSLAVLPLENLARDSAEEYFADGMTEALITRLSQIGSLEVKSRTSAMQYKGSRKPMAEIAEELDVDALVEGTVLRVEDRVLITAQLIHGPSDRHLWANSYERDLRDILGLLSEVAQAIAGEIEAVLTPEERARLSRTREVDPEVQEAYLKGRYHLVKMTVDGANRAIEYFEEAIENDPTYAAPYAGLAIAWNLLGQPLGAVPTREGMPKAKAAAEKALSLDPDLADAYLVLGLVSFGYDWDWQKAERLLERGLELDPSSPMAHHAYGVYLADAVGRYEEGIAEGIRAVELDPLSLFYRAGLAEFYHSARQYDRALEEARKVLDMDPNFNRARVVMLWVYEGLGMCEEYLALRRERLMGSGAEPEALARQAALEQACADSGFVGIWRWRLERRLESIAAGEYVRPSALARNYARLGRMDEAFEWLERAFEERDGNLAFIKTEPAYDGLRSDPRFQDLLRRMNFPE